MDTAWRVGDTLLVATTDNQGPKDSELVTITGIGSRGAARSVTIAEPLKRAHLGCEADGEDSHVKGIPCTLAAEVAPLTRNVRIHGEDACKDDQACGHFVIAHTNRGHVCGAELFAMGQRTNKGKYPLHLHMGGDAPELLVQSNSIHDTFNRGIVNHAVSYGSIIDNTIHNTLGHCFLNEDGVEQHNKIHHNLGP